MEKIFRLQQVLIHVHVNMLLVISFYSSNYVNEVNLRHIRHNTIF